MPDFQAPNTNLIVDQWSVPYPLPAGFTWPPGFPVHPGIPCAVRKPSVAEAITYNIPNFANVDLIIEFLPRPAGSPTRYFSTFDAVSVAGPPGTQQTVFELPPGSGQVWICLRSVVRGRGYPNEHKCCFCQKFNQVTSVEKN